jgi:anti-anti-sigma factor
MRTTDDIAISEIDGKTVVTARGEFDHNDSRLLTAAFSNAAETGRPLVVDFRQVQFVDSSVLMTLLLAAKTVNNEEWRLRLLVRPKSQPEHAVAVVGFDAVMDIEATSSDGRGESI